MHRFAVKPEIYYSSGAVSCLARQGIEKILIIIDPVMKENGAGYNIERAFAGKSDAAFSYYADIKPDPAPDSLTGGVQKALDFRPDLIVAVGGGSAIDAAKAIVFLYVKIAPARDAGFKKPLFAAIPTTSGTGSEVTNISVITVDGVKKVLVDDAFLPDLAIIDADFTKTLPLSILADTVFDALTHALEAYISSRASDCADAFAEKAIKLIFRYLKEILASGDNPEARSRLHHAACIAGMSFTNASLGINHSMAHALASSFGVAHGKANAVFLAHTLKFNAKAPYVAEKLAVLSQEMGFARRGIEKNDICVMKLLIKIKQLSHLCGVPSSVHELGISLDGYIKEIPKMTMTAAVDICTVTNPVRASAEDFIKLFLLAY